MAKTIVKAVPLIGKGAAGIDFEFLETNSPTSDGSPNIPSTSTLAQLAERPLLVTPPKDAWKGWVAILPNTCLLRKFIH